MIQKAPSLKPALRSLNFTEHHGFIYLLFIYVFLELQIENGPHVHLATPQASNLFVSLSLCYAAYKKQVEHICIAELGCSLIMLNLLAHTLTHFHPHSYLDSYLGERHHTRFD